MIWDDQKVVAFDFESSGTLPEYALQPWRMARGDMWITSVSAIKFVPGEGLVPHLSQLFPKREQLERFLLDVLENNWTVLGWNVAYDISLLLALGLTELVMKIRWLDGMLLERHFDIEPEYEFQSRRHLKKSYALKGTPDRPGAIYRWLPSRVGRNQDVDFHATDPESLAKLQHYNDDDNVDTWLIAKMIWRKLSPAQQRCALIEAESLPMVAQANLEGLVIDQLTAKHLGAKLDLDAAARLKELAPDGMTEKIVRSPKQLAELMFDKWNLPVLKTNKSKVEGKEDSRSTDKEVLHELAFIDPRARGVKQYREALNAKGKFATSVLESVAYNGDGRVHPIGNIFSTYTGRMTYSSKQGKGVNERPIGFAVHQMKREEEYREIVTVEEGYDLVEFDAAGQEFRWMAVASADPTMLNLCFDGEDAHSFMGAQIMGVDYRDLMRRFQAKDKTAKDNRYLGKFANLSLQYRTSARKLRVKARIDYDIPIELPEAQRIHATYRRSYPGVPVYWDHQIALVRSLGYVETFGGRRVQVQGNWDGDWGWSMGSTAINTRIQGTGADQKYLAMMVLKHPLQQFGGKFLLDYHDGIYLAVPSGIRQKAVIEMKHLLDNLPYQQAWGFTPPIPMPWDCKAGKAWGRLEEVKFD